MEIRRYMFKLYPRPTQVEVLNRQRWLHCQLYNAALEERIGQWRRECESKGKGDRRGLSLYQQQNQLKTIRAADPEYRALSSTSMEMTLARLDNAFKAFFRRAKAGAGHQSGYPRFKRSADYPGFTFRKHGNGWRVTLGEGLRNGRVYLKGCPGMIKMRGKLPAAFDEIRTCDVIWRDEAWWLSLVVKMAKRRQPGDHPLRVNFSLIDEFARVKRTDGPRGAGPEAIFQMVEGRITPEYQQGMQVPPAGTPDLRGKRGLHSAGVVRSQPAGTPDLRGKRGDKKSPSPPLHPAGTQDSRGKRGIGRVRHVPSQPADTVDSRGEPERVEIIQQAMARCKRGSNRYRRLKRRKAKIEAQAARRRREALHEWTTALVRAAAMLDVVRPTSISAATESGHGTEKNPGAAVDMKAEFNSHVLEQAPALAVSMLAYKAEEAGIAYSETSDDALEIGNAVVATRKAVKRAKRLIRREREPIHV